MKSNQELQNHENWVIQLPDRVTQFLLGLYWVMSQWNPCDSTSVSMGSSLYLILIGLALGFFTSIDRLLGESRHTISLPWKLAITGFFAWLLLATYQVFDRGNFRSATLGFWQSVSLLGVASMPITSSQSRDAWSPIYGGCSVRRLERSCMLCTST